MKIKYMAMNDAEIPKSIINLYSQYSIWGLFGNDAQPIDFTTFVGVLLDNGSLDTSMVYIPDISEISKSNFINAINYGISTFYMHEETYKDIISDVSRNSCYIENLFIIQQKIKYGFSFTSKYKFV